MAKFMRPPLPFCGQKSLWFCELDEFARRLPHAATVWDVFGGSGLVSRRIKDARPDCRVIWNDFDNYAERLAHIAETEQLRRALPRVAPIEGLDGKYARLQGNARDAVAVAIAAHIRRYGFVDAITVSGWLSLGISILNMQKLPSVLFSKIRLTPLPCADAARWLKGLDRVRADAASLEIPPGDFVVLDPPYARCDNEAYLGNDPDTAFDAVKRLVRTNPFMLFGDLKNLPELLEVTSGIPCEYIEKSGFNTCAGKCKNSVRTEVCFCNW